MLICPIRSVAREQMRRPGRSSRWAATCSVRPRRSSGRATPGCRGPGRGPRRGRTWPRGPGIPTPGSDRALRPRGSERWTPGAVPAGRRRGTRPARFPGGRAAIVRLPPPGALDRPNRGGSPQGAGPRRRCPTGNPSEGPLLAEFPDIRLEPLRVDFAIEESAKARAPMFDQDPFPGIEDNGRLALLEMIFVSELLREGDLTFRADRRCLRHRPKVGPSGIISLLVVKKYYSESVFPGHTILNLERQALQSNPRPQGHGGLLKLSRKSERRATLHRGKSLTRGSSPMDVWG